MAVEKVDQIIPVDVFWNIRSESFWSKEPVNHGGSDPEGEWQARRCDYNRIWPCGVLRLYFQVGLPLFKIQSEAAAWGGRGSHRCVAL
jgi:hypothetical protein